VTSWPILRITSSAFVCIPEDKIDEIWKTVRPKPLF
jgi:hypothetical protein